MGWFAGKEMGQGIGPHGGVEGEEADWVRPVSAQDRLGSEKTFFLSFSSNLYIFSILFELNSN
jgi:hypothetical protein